MEINVPVSVPVQTVPQAAVVGNANMAATTQGMTTRNSDFFAVLFQQLGLGVTGQNQSCTFTQPQTNAMLQLLKKQADAEGTELSMQMSAEFLANFAVMSNMMTQQTLNPADQNNVNNPAEGIELPGITKTGQKQQVLFGIPTELQPPQLQPQAEAIQTTAIANEGSTPILQTQTLETVGNTVLQPQFQKSGKADTTAASNLSQASFNVSDAKGQLSDTDVSTEYKPQTAATKMDLLTAQNQFNKVVQSVQKALKTDGNQVTEDLDVEKMQKDVDSKIHISSTVPQFNTVAMQSVRSAKEPEAAKPFDFAAQVESGIKTGLQAGKSEFIIKLKPEGLGEITVKMVEEGGKIALNLIASTSHVEKLLNSELASLQQSLKPYNVEVQPAITQPSATSSYTALNYGQNFSQHQHQQFENQSRSSPWQGTQNGTRSESDIAQESVSVMPPASPALSGLDTYI